MEKSKTAEEMRELLISQRPDLKDDLENISDLELLQLMACAYECTTEIKEAELKVLERRLDEYARALFSPKPH